MKAPLLPAEIARRHQACMDAYQRAHKELGALEVMVAGATVFPPGVHTVVSYAAAQSWAIAQGLCRRGQPVDLHALNSRRKVLGLPPFALKDCT